MFTVIDGTEAGHNIQLFLALLDIGVFRRGEFSFQLTCHDDWCPTLRTQRAIDCRCDCEVMADGKTYSYNEVVGGRN